MQFSLAIVALLATATAMAKPFPSPEDPTPAEQEMIDAIQPAERCWDGHLTKIESSNLQYIAEQFYTFEASMLEKYPTHYCLWERDDCKQRCKYEYDWTSKDGLVVEGCMEPKDLLEYATKKATLKQYREQLDAKYAEYCKKD